MIDTSIQGNGKIRFIEPNDFLNKNGRDNIVNSYEDYSISVNLVVKVPNRFGANDEHVLYNSFFSGTNGYMSDTPGTTVYKDIVNNEMAGVNENLGITNINISYDSYFYPRVTINFTDIRGSALMMPNEENYLRQMVNQYKKSVGEKEVYDTNVTNFFKSLFSFPSPEFILSVKGFYGKKIEYSLMVNDFRSRFNPNTGNFDATLQLIGKMYGVYTDIPMSYLLISPYSKYGNDSNETIWERKSFKMDNGFPMPTFLELRKKLLEAKDELSIQNNKALINEYTVLRNLEIKLMEVKNVLDELINFLKRVKGNNNDITLDTNSCFIIPENKIDILYPTISNEFSSLIIKIYETIDNFNNETNSKLPYIEGLSNRQAKLGDNKELYLHFKRVNENEVLIDGHSSFFDDNFNLKAKYEKLNLKQKFLKTPLKEEDYHVLSFEKLKNEIIKLNNNNNENIKSKKEEFQNKSEENLSEIFGFKPSIKNVFTILMAHLEVFTEIYYNFITNVKNSNENRKKGIETILDKICDLPLNSENNIIPPFPAFKNDENEYSYPKALDFNIDFEECDLIDSFFDSLYDTKKIITGMNNQVDNSDIELIPTCLSDLYLIDNPYKYVFNNNNSTIFVDWIMTFFGLRLINSFWFKQNILLSDNKYDFGKYEAYNFWKANKNLDDSIIELIKNENFNGSNFIKFLQAQDNLYNFGNKPSYMSNLLSEIIKQDENNENEYLYQGNAFLLCRDNNGFNTFLLDNKNNTDDYSFVSGYSPYKYVKFCKKELIDDWRDKINSIEFPNTLNDTTVDINKFLDSDVKKNTFQKIYLDGTNIKYIDNSNDKNLQTLSIYESKDDDIKMGHFKNISEISKEDSFSTNNLSVLGCGKVDLFFNTGLTPELFLFSLSFNNEKNIKFFNGKLIEMPYVFSLYLGMIISYLKKADEIDDIPFLNLSFHHTETNLLNVSKYYNILRYDGWEYKINIEEDIIPYLYEVIRLKDTDGNNVYLDIENAYETPVISKDTVTNYNNTTINISRLQSLFTKIKNEKYEVVDFLNLSDEYECWANDEKPGGFLYFKKNYTLNVKDNNFGKYGTLFKYLENIKEVLQEWNVLDEKSKSFFDEIFESNYGEKSKTSFSDRYSVISVGKKGGFHAHFNKDFKIYKELSNFFSKKIMLITPSIDFKRQGITYNTKQLKNDFEYKDIINHFKTFRDTLRKLYSPSNSDNKEGQNNEKNIIDDDVKLSMYRTLKNLYDKHFSTLDKNDEIERFKINSKSGIDTEFSRIHYIDTFYNDIGDKLLFNNNILLELLNILTGNGTYNENINSDISVYSFMSLLCQKHNMMLLSMPVFNGNLNNKDGIENLKTMFTPIAYNDAIGDNVIKGPSYICFYPHQASQHLDISDGQYMNDGFNVTDINETGNFSGPLELKGEPEKYVIPTFSVEYGSQKQSIFKSVNVNMDNPQTTEVAVAMQFDLIKSNNSDPKKIVYEGQDLYKIFSNYSFTCQVEMMGCAQIQPLMYFQLNNIPMFRGTYQIIQVEHNIVPGDMTTSFKGVRINKTKIPMVKNMININIINDYVDNISEYDKIKFEKPDFTGLLFGDNKKENMSVYKEGDAINYNDITGKTNNLMFANISTYIPTATTITEDVKKEESFNNLNPYLRKVLFGLSNRMNDNNMGIQITSMTRNTGSTTSDHYIDSINNIRVAKNLNKVGCAIDMQGVNNSKRIDKINGSIPLFHLIATEFTSSIEQLIWEVGVNNSTSENIISNCIHLSCYNGEGNSCQIFVAILNANNKYESVKANNDSDYSNAPTNLPPLFIKTLRDLSENNEKYSKVRLNNFGSKKPSKEDLNRWCKELNV